MLMRKILRMLREEKDPQKVKRSERFCRKSREVKYSQKVKRSEIFSVERSERFCRNSSGSAQSSIPSIQPGLG